MPDHDLQMPDFVGDARRDGLTDFELDCMLLTALLVNTLPIEQAITNVSSPDAADDVCSEIKLLSQKIGEAIWCPDDLVGTRPVIRQPKERAAKRRWLTARTECDYALKLLEAGYVAEASVSATRALRALSGVRNVEKARNRRTPSTGSIPRAVQAHRALQSIKDRTGLNGKKAREALVDQRPDLFAGFQTTDTAVKKLCRDGRKQLAARGVL